MNFFVLTKQRSGSTWLRSLLNGQDGVSAYGELFLPYAPREKMLWLSEGDPRRFIDRRTEIGKFRAISIWRYLEEVESHTPYDNISGFNLMMSEVRLFPELIPILAARRYCLVVLTRENYFEAVVSEMISRLTGVPHGTDESRSIAGVFLDPEQVVRRITARRRALRAMQAIARLWPAPSINVAYEDLVSDQHAQMARILAMFKLNQQPSAFDSPLKKRIRVPYRDLIGNFDEIKSTLVSAGYGKFVEGVF